MMGPPDERDMLLLHAAIDRELDPANAIAVEQRIAADPALAQERAWVEALRQALREQLPRGTAPPALRARIERAIGIGAGRAQPSWRALAASVALAAVLSSGATWYAARLPAGDGVTEAVVAGHVRALMAPQPTDIASSDQHTVKPWFAGRIPQAPRVVDLASEGFPLVGGRIDVVGRTPVPSLVYSRRAHLISLTAVPSAIAPAPRSQTAQGFTVIGWSAQGVSYWAVSDLNRDELDTFVRLFRAAPL